MASYSLLWVKCAVRFFPESFSCPPHRNTFCTPQRGPAPSVRTSGLDDVTALSGLKFYDSMNHCLEWIVMLDPI